MMPETYIKTEPDDGTQIHHGSYSNNNDLMSRSLLTRGFNSNFDDYPSNSMIDDSDLLDLEGLNSPELNPYSIPHSSLSHLGPPPPVPPNSTASNAHAMAAASIGFSSNTPSRPILSSSFSKQYGSTPPIPESTSPFDDFMLTNSRMANRPIQQQSMRNQQDLRMAALSSPRPADFQRVQGLNSATSTPVGSYEYPGSPPIHSAAALKKGGGGGTPSSLPPNSPDDKQQLLLAERRRRRRESHNAVERRRRDNINEKIKELADLLPEAFLLGTTEPGSYSVVTKDEKPNKGTILSRSVDYIKQLQGVIDDQNRRELELQEQVNSLQAQCGIPQTEFKYTSAELALSKLGVSNDMKSPDSSSQQGLSGGTPNSLSNQEDPTAKYSIDY